MRNAIDYTSRLLIVEAPDSDWNMTAYPMISVDREIGCQRWVGWSDASFYGMQFLHKQLMFSISYIYVFL